MVQGQEHTQTHTHTHLFLQTEPHTKKITTCKHKENTLLFTLHLYACGDAHTHTHLQTPRGSPHNHISFHSLHYWALPPILFSSWIPALWSHFLQSLFFPVWPFSLSYRFFYLFFFPLREKQLTVMSSLLGSSWWDGWMDGCGIFRGSNLRQK